MSLTVRNISASLKIIFFALPAIGWQNNPPSVKLINLSKTKDLQWNAFISYKIFVTDKEDGLSDKNQISPNEVLLKVKFFPDSNLAVSYIKKENSNLPEATGISMIKSFNCFTCHRVKTKLTGPSFDSIATRYPPTQVTFDRLADKIIKGSKSVWAQTEMPPHPDVTNVQAKDMLQWIFKNSTSPDLDYLVGFDGIIHTKPKPANPGSSVYVLTASYTDHGLPDKPNTQKRGQQILILRSSEK